MTGRFLLILIAVFWCTLAGASELGADYTEKTVWTEVSVSATQLTNKADADAKTDEHKSKKSKSDAAAPKQKRSRLDGMFDLLLPSNLRENP